MTLRVRALELKIERILVLCRVQEAGGGLADKASTELGLPCNADLPLQVLQPDDR